MSRKGKGSSKETGAIKIEAIKMKGSGESSIPGLGNFDEKDERIYLVPDEVSETDARNLVDRDIANSVKRSEPSKEAAPKQEAPETPTKEEVINNGE